MRKGESKHVGAVRHTRKTWELPKHLEAMFKQACKECVTKEKEGQLADLLTRYEAVLSKNDQEVGRTELVHYGVQLQKEPDLSGNFHIDLDHIRSRRRSARCKTFWREA